jgi:hypothetical protein
MPAERLLFCGMSIGHRNLQHPVNQLVSERAGLAQFASFHGV